MSIAPIAAVALHYDYDLVVARRRARNVAALLGFGEQDQTRIATVVSEIARNALRYGGGGRVEFSLLSDEGAQSLRIVVRDDGPGIQNLDEILAGRYRSKTGMGMGLVGARRLMSDFSIASTPGAGTTVTMSMRLPRTAPFVGNVQRIADELAKQRPVDPVEELQQQNGALLGALADLNERQRELERLNQELEDTNRGVLALYAELDEKAESLRRADIAKSRFLSDMSHEFRTPVNAILALARLLEEADLGVEQRKQLALIQRAAEDLATLVNDLLDLAKIESGKVDVRTSEVEIPNLFSALRGMLRPLLLNRSLALVFIEPEDLPVMITDEAKLSQILRNFISNALKFTAAGEVRVSAQLGEDGKSIEFAVADTGIGIAPEDRERIFEEFAQIDSPMQRTSKGTGLGLPLTRKLAALLGGSVRVESEVGVGSTFYAIIPIVYTDPHAAAAAELATISAPPAGPLRILLIDDDEAARYTMRALASRDGVEISEADNGLDGIARAQAEHPDLIMLDLMMPGIGGHEVLQRLKADPATSAIPVVIVTSRFVNDAERKQILSRAAGAIYKGDLSRDVVASAIASALHS